MTVKILLPHNRYQLPGSEDEVYRRELEMLVDHSHEVIEYTRDNREIAQYGVGSKATLAVRTTGAWGTYRQIGTILAEARLDLRKQTRTGCHYEHHRDPKLG